MMLRIILVLATSLLLVPAVLAQEPDVWIWRYDGTLQCGQGVQRTLESDEKTLENLVPKVLSSQKRVVPFKIIAMCGAPTGLANSYLISKVAWEELKTSFVGPVGFVEWTFDTGNAWVYKYDGTLQCKFGKEVPLLDMAKELTNAGIEVLDQKKGSDGFLHPAVCGNSTGQINLYQIAVSFIPVAQALGFVLAVPDTYILPSTQPASDGLPTPWPFPW